MQRLLSRRAQEEALVVSRVDCGSASSFPLVVEHREAAAAAAAAAGEGFALHIQMIKFA